MRIRRVAPAVFHPRHRQNHRVSFWLALFILPKHRLVRKAARKASLQVRKEKCLFGFPAGMELKLLLHLGPDLGKGGRGASQRISVHDFDLAG